MTTISDQERKAYEQYLISTTDEEKQEAIKKLVPGSHPYYHLYFLDVLNKVGSNLTEEQIQHLAMFILKYPFHAYTKQIQARLLLLKYDNSQTEEAKRQVLAQIERDYLHLNFQNFKPEDFRRGNASESSQSEDEDESGQVDTMDIFGGNIPAKQQKLYEFNYNLFFGKNRIKVLIKGNIDKVDISLDALNKLPLGYEQEINFREYNQNAVYLWASQNGNSRISDINNESFYEVISNYLNLIMITDKFFMIDARICSSLTLKQLDKICSTSTQLKGDKNYIGAYFQKLFHEELSKENQEFWGLEEKRANLERLYAYAKGKDMPKSLQSSLVLEILELGIKVGIFDEKLFRDYLTMPQAIQHNVFKEVKEANEDLHWGNYIGNVQSSKQQAISMESTQSELIQKYLEHFCQEKKSLDSFKDDFDTQYLKGIQDKVSIYNSDDMTNLNMDLSKYQQYSSEIILRFLESNKEQFKTDEEVSLQIELKNIQTLYTKIFEFNTETYYKKTLQPFNTAVNLEGLVASEEKIFEYKHPSNRKFKETFTFPEINNKVGLFIVEFIGNGMSARAIIKKGSLSLIHKPTIAGHLAYILDENKQICTSNQTGLYFDNQYYPAEEKTGKIFIHYGKTNLNSKAILINQGFAQMSDFTRMTEVYEFNAVIIVNPESILIGNKASIIVRPALKINQRQAGVEMLKNSVITLTTLNYIDNIPVTKKFENLKFENNKELIIDFQVPPYLKQISITFDTSVQNVTLQKTQTFTIKKDIQVQTHEHSTQMCEVFLRKENNDSFIYLLGKNGEPKRNVKISITFLNLKYMKVIQGEKTILTTNKEGKVKLGFIKHMTAIQVSVPLFAITAKFLINPSKSNINYSKQLDTIENEPFEFPIVNFKTLNRKKVSFLKLQDGNVFEDLFDQLIFKKDNGKLYSTLSIQGLGVGTYELFIKGIGQIIQINVHRGNLWESDNFILKKNCLFENRVAQKVIKIAAVKIEEEKDGQQNIVIQLADFTKDARVHVIALQFQPTSTQEIFNSLSKSLQERFQQTIFPFANWKNIFLSNRELGDEFRYVFDRKYAERVIGNSLDKPKLLLKRNFIKVTTIDQEMLKHGTAYEQVQTQGYQPSSQNYQQQSIQPQQSQMIAQDFYNVSPSTSLNARHPESSFLQLQDRISSQSVTQEFQNFLKNSPFVLFNIVPSANGIIQFNANLAPYTQLVVLALDNNSAAQTEVDLPINKILKRDLSLVTPLDSTKGFTETRSTLTLNMGEPYLVEDITSTEIQLVDDLTKVKAILEELQRAYSITSSLVFKDLSFILKWSKFNKEEKNQQFSQFTCHELHIFLFFKDREYFEEIVKPFIEYKMEKTFIDFYLLGQYEPLLKYNNIYNLQKLNAIEQCFLIDVYVKKGEEKEALKIMEYLKYKTELSENKEINYYNRIFDIVLNLNMLKGDNLIPEFDDFSEEESSKNKSYNNQSQLQLQQQQVRQARQIQQMQQQQQTQMFQNAATHLQMPMAFGGAMNVSVGGMESFHPQLSSSSATFGTSAGFGQQNNFAFGEFSQTSGFSNVQAQSYASQQHDLFSDFADPYNQVPQTQTSTLAERKKIRATFSEIEQTNQYAETQYYKVSTLSSFKDLVQVNSFWVDYGTYLLNGGSKAKQPFLSGNFWRNYSMEVSSFLTLALLDQPVLANQHEFRSKGRDVEINCGNSLILFKKEVKEAAMNIKNEIMATHRYVSDQQVSDQSVPDEFLSSKVYSCEIILTNASPSIKSISLLYQIPQGSLPLQMTKYMKSIPMTLQAYSTDRFTFQFYFPEEGKFEHFPSNISQEQVVVSKAIKNTINVVKNYTVVKKETFKDILNCGNKEEIYEFLRTKNLEKCENGFKFTDLLWMLTDYQFFLQVVHILHERYIFHLDIWSYSFFHKGDEQTLKEYLSYNRQSSTLSQLVGYNFQSKLLDIQASDKDLKHLDFYPMINSRVHAVGDSASQWSLNKDFKATYDKFLLALLEKPKLSIEDKMNLVQYLQLQDRVNEAIQIFNKIEFKQQPDNTLKIQYDYMSAYFDFFKGSEEGFKKARSIVREYEDYPVLSWRVLFLEILDQLNEYDGEFDSAFDQQYDPDLKTEHSKQQNYKLSIKREPTLSVEIKEQNLIIQSANIKKIVAKFYFIDVETLFSRTPFVKEKTEEFSYVKACRIIEKDITVNNEQAISTQLKSIVEIPADLVKKNMVIEINGEGKQIFKTYYSSQLKVTLLENYGELKVTDKEGNPLPKIYIKVFSQKKSSKDPLFFKDGYTDIRGKFVYAQTTGSKLTDVKKFAILVMSDDQGSVIKECNPPSQGASGAENDNQEQQKKVERIQNKIAQISKKKNC